MWKVLEECQSTESDGWNFSQHHFESGAFKKLKEDQMIEALWWCAKEKKSAGKYFFIFTLTTSDAFQKYCEIRIYRSALADFVKKVKRADKDNLEKLLSSIEKGKFILCIIIFVRNI